MGSGGRSSGTERMVGYNHGGNGGKPTTEGHRGYTEDTVFFRLRERRGTF